MREIKFRAKKICDGDWEYGGYYERKGDHFIVNELGEHWEVNRETLGQYTGLKAEYDTEIYEGDIFDGGYVNSLTGKDEKRIYEVAFNDMGLWGKLIGKSPYGDKFLCWLVKANENFNKDVIGNIHDNPELMEVE